MRPSRETERYIYRTRGVCPQEIHFQIEGGLIRDVRFVGGGCPGNAQLVARLLKGRPVDVTLPLLDGIPCRDGTSCPDQLARALMEARDGALTPARSFRVLEDAEVRGRLGLLGELGGRPEVLDALITTMRKNGVERIYCLGNITGCAGDHEALLKLVRQTGILATAGERDWQYAHGRESGGLPQLDQRDRDYLLRFPQVIHVRFDDHHAMGFFGDYILSLPGFSDFEPFALEMNMVCKLTGFMQDETVFPALAAMTAQFTCRVVIFSQIQRWGHWRVGGVNFISLGPAEDENGLAWGMLQGGMDGIDFQVQRVS